MKKLTWLEVLRRKLGLKQSELAEELNKNNLGLHFVQEEFTFYENVQRNIPRRKRPVILKYFLIKLGDNFPTQVYQDNLQEEVIL